MNKLSFIRINNFCSSKDTVKGVKRQATDWKKIHTVSRYNKGLECQKYKNPYKSTGKEPNNTIENGKELNRCFTEPVLQTANKRMK